MRFQIQTGVGVGYVLSHVRYGMYNVCMCGSCVHPVRSPFRFNSRKEIITAGAPPTGEGRVYFGNDGGSIFALSTPNLTLAWQNAPNITGAPPR